MKTILQNTLLFAFTAVCTLAMLLQTRAVAGLGTRPGWLELFVFGSTVFAYNAYASGMWRRAGAVVFAVPLLYAWWQLPGTQQWATLAPGLVWGVYLGLPGKMGLRELPWLKPFAVSLAWGFVTVWLPLPPALWPLWIFAFLGRSAFVFGLALGYDLVDRGEDYRHGLQTLAGVLGVQATLRVANIAFGVSAFMGLLNFGLSLIPLRVLLVLLLSLALSAWLLRWQLRTFGPNQWQKITIDAMLFLQALGVVFILGV